jgi:hypothetical protein
MMARAKSFDLSVFAALAVVMLITRTHSLSPYFHVPDTSLASFFVAGFYIRSALALPALMALGFGIDVVVINIMGGSNFCFTPAYAMLVPAYGVMGGAGRLAAARLRSLPMIGLLFVGAVLISQILSSGGFYVLSGRFDHPTLAGFLPRFMRYAPGVLLSSLIWAMVAVLCHAAAVLMGRTGQAEQSR